MRFQQKRLTSACFIGIWTAFCMAMAPPAWAYTDADCIQCHGPTGDDTTPSIDIQAYEASVHAEQAGCMDCHTQVVDETHTEVNGAGAVDCSNCHDQDNHHGAQGQSEQRPQCATCHTRHTILPPDDPASTVHPGQFAQTCGHCHADKFRKPDAMVWLPELQVATHHKADLSYAYSRQDCIGCHQGQAVHGESEPVNKADCFRCHLDENGSHALMGVVHSRAGFSGQWPIFWAGLVYRVAGAALLIGGVGFFVHKFSRKIDNRGVTGC